MEPQGAPHHVRHDEMPLQLLYAEIEERDPQRRDGMRDERVEDRRECAEPGADVRDQLGDARPGAEEEGVLAAVVKQAEHPEDPNARPGARADDEREQKLSLDVARHGLLHALEQRLAVQMRREPPVDPGFEARHVEQDVDRHDDHEYRAEEKRHDREPGPLGPVQRLRRVLLDILRPDRVEELVATLLDVDPLQVVRVEPQLQPVDIALRVGLPGLSVLGRKVRIDPM